MIVVSATHIKKAYGTHVSLRDASLTMRQGEILALLGANGAGKTTLIKILATLLQRDEGDVKILGYDLDRNEREIRHLIGYVGQDTERSAYARLTVMENLMFFGRLRNLKGSYIKQQVGKLCDYFDFGGQMDKQFMQLSGGQKQTVVIMRALLHDPPVIFLDEPTKGLDPIISKKIRTFLKQYVASEGKSMLLTSHILTEVEEMADRVSLISGGSIPVTERPDVLKSSVGAKEFIEIFKADLPDATRERILELDSVLLLLDRDPEWVSFGVRDFFDGTEDIVRLLRAENVRARMRHHTVTLEDAFIRQVGALADTFER